MFLVVGCPVSHRAWALPAWGAAVRASAEAAGLSVGRDGDLACLFVCDPDDLETVEAVNTLDETVPCAVDLCPDGRAADERDWRPDRYRHMVVLRNRLLRSVRGLRPDAYLSLDSDIILHKDTVGNLLESAGRFDAVGGRAYMTSTGTSCPSWGYFSRAGGLRRHDREGVFPVEVVMAVKLMTPAAYAVDYAYHSHGEDLGWSKGCAAAGLKLGVDARSVNKHCMSPEALTKVDPRCGF